MKDSQTKKEGFLGQKMITLPPNIINEVEQNGLINGFYASAIGYYPRANNHDRRRKFGCEEFIILYCIEGEGDIEIETEDFKLEQDTFIIIPPNVQHHYYSSITKPWTIYWAHFKGEKAETLYNRYYTDGPYLTKVYRGREKFQQKFRRIIAVMEIDFQSATLDFSNIMLFDLVSMMMLGERFTPSRGQEDTITKSIDFMSENISTNLKVAELAEEQNLSVSRYSKLFKEKTGYSAIQYFLKLKIEKACQELYFTDISVKEVSLKFGFDDPYYFSRVFKKIMGMPPSKYRYLYKKKSLSN